MENKELNSYEKAMIITAERVSDPQVGDIFHEMLHFMVYVVERSEDCVKVITSTKEIKTLNLLEFEQWLSYKHSPGYWVFFLGNNVDRTNEVLVEYLNPMALNEQREHKINYLF